MAGFRKSALISVKIEYGYCRGRRTPPSFKKTIYQQVLKLGANEASAQGLQNAIYNDCHTKFLTKLWAFENRQFCMRTVWGQGV